MLFALKRQKSSGIKILIEIPKPNYIPTKIMHKSDKEPKQRIKHYPQHNCSHKEYKTKCPFPLQTAEHVPKNVTRIFKDDNVKIAHKNKNVNYISVIMSRVIILFCVNKVFIQSSCSLWVC